MALKWWALVELAEYDWLVASVQYLIVVNPKKINFWGKEEVTKTRKLWKPGQ